MTYRIIAVIKDPLDINGCVELIHAHKLEGVRDFLSTMIADGCGDDLIALQVYYTNDKNQAAL